MAAAAEQRLWSVTTLIDQGLPKPALLNWVGRTVAEYAVDNLDHWASLAKADRDGAVKLLVDSRFRKSGKAMERGTLLHQAAEQLALGVEPDVEEQSLPYVEQYRRFLDEHTPEFVAAEAPVYNLRYHYAGTMDGIVRLDGRVCIFDIKTTDRGPNENRARPPYPEVALQLSAYAHADVIGIEPAAMRQSGGRRYYVWVDGGQSVPMPELDGALALVISPVDYQLVPVDIGEQTWRAFLHVREVARWQLDLSRQVLGPAVAAPKEAVA